jgi:hypothetical protein
MNRQGKIMLLLFCFAICGTALLVSQAVKNRREQTQPSELYSIVYSQVISLRNADYSSAYRHASAGIQQKLNIEQFTEMIRHDYPGISTADRVEFGAAEYHGRRALVQVFFVNGKGEVIPCIYSLVHEGEAWKIDGARVVKPPGHAQRLSGIRS